MKGSRGCGVGEDMGVGEDVEVETWGGKDAGKGIGGR